MAIYLPFYGLERDPFGVTPDPEFLFMTPGHREALAQLEQDGFAPQLILLDVAMPALDGYAFAEELGRRGLRPGLPIVVITADGRAPQKAARVGANGYLAKPFSLTALVDAVSRHLQTDPA